MDPHSQNFLSSSVGRMLVQQHGDYLNKIKNESIEKEVGSFVDHADRGL